MENDLLICLMHQIEPFFGWRNLYIAENDVDSPFYGREYSEFYFSDAIYDHYIHPQWDSFESNTLFIKLLYVDYNSGFAVIEMIGEWNDALHNDIMLLKRNIIEELNYQGINKFILIGEHILNFHYSDDCYYEEWFEEVEDGWIAALNFLPHVVDEMKVVGIDQYFLFGGTLDEINWRTFSPPQLFKKIDDLVSRRLE